MSFESKLFREFADSDACFAGYALVHTTCVVCGSFRLTSERVSKFAEWSYERSQLVDRVVAKKFGLESPSFVVSHKDLCGLCR